MSALISKPTQSNRILEYLQNHPEGVFVYQLIAPRPNGFGIAQYNARIYELRKKGYDIRSDKEGHFVLHTEPTQQDLFFYPAYVQ